MRNIINISDVNNLILEQTKSDRALENNEIEITRDDIRSLRMGYFRLYLF